MIYKIIILALTAMVGIGLIYKQWGETKTPYVPSFHIKQCFLFNMEKQGNISGLITSFEGDYYLVLWYGEADRRYAGPKMGVRVPMKWLDMYASRVKCKQGWGGH